jgi:uncharacterized membrane protein YcaP (DUF421 family)
MGLFASIEWSELYLPDKPVLEIFLRGTMVYLAIFFLLRVLLKRQAGNVGLSDMLLIVLIADASQNAMANDYRSVPDGLILVGTLIFWNYALDWLAFRIPGFTWLVESPPLPLIRNGQVLKDNLRQECITEEDLRCQLRKKGYADPSQVTEGYIEGDGHFSFLPPPVPGKLPRLGTPASNGNDHPEAENANALPPNSEPAPEEGEAYRKFLDAARSLQAAVAWHRQRIAEHQTAITAITGTLSRHGVRAKAFLGEQKPTGPTNTPSVEANGTIPEGE